MPYSITAVQGQNPRAGASAFLGNLEKSVGAFPGSRVPIRWTCEEGDKYDSENRCHSDLAVAGADYNYWLEHVSQYVTRTPPPKGRGGDHPEDHLVIWLDNGKPLDQDAQ